MLLPQRSPRSGAFALETALVLSVFIVLLLGMVVGGTGVFLSQQVTCLSQEASRWAAVHGSDWATTTKSSPAMSQDIFNNAVAPLAVGLYPNNLTAQVWWVNGTTGTATSWDSSSRAPNSLDANNNTVTNRVRVTVTYQWIPGFFFMGPLTLQSTSEIPMFF